MLPISISQTVPSFTPAAPALMLAALVLLHPCLMETQRYLIAQKSLRTCSGFSKHTWGPQCYLVHGCSTSASKFVQTHPPSSPFCGSSFSNWQSTPLKRQPPNHLHLCQTSLFGVFFHCREAPFVTSMPLAAPLAALPAYKYIKPCQSNARALADPSTSPSKTPRLHKTFQRKRSTGTHNTFGSTGPSASPADLRAHFMITKKGLHPNHKKAYFLVDFGHSAPFHLICFCI